MRSLKLKLNHLLICRESLRDSILPQIGRPLSILLFQATCHHNKQLQACMQIVRHPLTWHSTTGVMPMLSMVTLTIGHQCHSRCHKHNPCNSHSKDCQSSDHMHQWVMAHPSTMLFLHTPYLLKILDHTCHSSSRHQRQQDQYQDRIMLNRHQINRIVHRPQRRINLINYHNIKRRSFHLPSKPNKINLLSCHHHLRHRYLRQRQSIIGKLQYRLSRAHHLVLLHQQASLQ